MLSLSLSDQTRQCAVRGLLASSVPLARWFVHLSLCLSVRLSITTRPPINQASSSTFHPSLQTHENRCTHAYTWQDRSNGMKRQSACDGLRLRQTMVRAWGVLCDPIYQLFGHLMNIPSLVLVDSGLDEVALQTTTCIAHCHLCHRWHVHR